MSAQSGFWKVTFAVLLANCVAVLPRSSATETSSPEMMPQADGNIFLSGGNWKLQAAPRLHGTPAAISEPAFDDHDWIPAVVPGTVLGSYLATGTYPDPWFGDQMSRVPDGFFSTNDFWYRCSFILPAEDAGRRVWVNFDGINWKADIFLNGAAVGRISGAFIRGHFDVTGHCLPGATNYLAVLIHHVAHPGLFSSGNVLNDKHISGQKGNLPGLKKVVHKKLGSPTTNGGVLGSDSPAFLASIGWNWLPIVSGREIGIWNDVRIETSGDVEMIDPWVITDLPLPKTNRADLTIKTELRNVNTTQPERGELIGQIGKLTFKQPVTLEPGQTRLVTLDKFNCPALSIAHPRLWWPNDYGDQPLYTLNLRFEQHGRTSDRKTVTFGIRKIQYVITNAVDSTNPMLVLYVNGRRILIRGGNWGMPEGMLNCDTAGYDLRVRLQHDAHLNMIRNWVGMTGSQAFYDACDKYGILIWDDFWLANPVDGPDPTDDAMFMANARDKIRRVRSHPSLALYCGRNEGMPPKALEAGLRIAVDQLDGTRHYIPDSAAGTVTGYGPYEDMNPEWYFANRGKTLHSELGIVAVPSVESMRAMMPATNLWPINDMWAVHDYQTPRSDHYTRRIIQRYGQPTGIEDYCRKAQMVNMETAKAMFECLQANQGSGVLIWMTQSAWPDLICQLYDYYFEPTAAYFGARNGAEPLHIFWDSNAGAIKVANDTLNDENDLTAEAWTYSLECKELWHKSSHASVPAGSARDCFALERPAEKPGVFLLRLKLRRGRQTLSDNFYWSSNNRDGSCTNLNDLPQVTVPVTAARSGRNRMTVQVTNATHSVALMIHLEVTVAGSGKRVLPVFYGDNYFSLLPGEHRTVSMELPDSSLARGPLAVAVDGWNVVPQTITVR